MATALLHRALVGTLPYLPRSLIRRFSHRYIAGDGLDDACRRVHELNASGCSATIDVLGEDSTTGGEVRAAVDLYVEALAAIAAQGLDCGISVKLSELGLRLDVDRCRRAIRTLADAARERGLFVRIDMEDSSVTDVTLRVYRELRDEFDNVGIVIQSCLRRSADDIDELLRDGPTDVRLCKGIYIEPESLAFVEADEIRESFVRLLRRLLDDVAARVGIATHDPALVARSEALIAERSVARQRYEFQMLLGVAGNLRRELVAKGHPLRVYVPFGERWYEYSMRRLRENPRIAGHIARNLLRAG